MSGPRVQRDRSQVVKGEESQEDPRPGWPLAPSLRASRVPWALRPWGRVNADLGVPVCWALPQLTLPNRFLPFLPSLLPGEGQTLFPHRAPRDVPASPSASPGPRCPVLGSDLQPRPGVGSPTWQPPLSPLAPPWPLLSAPT